ncbi:hypothetical protein QAD02_004401 [Eretmocerus hayati]|uniref:Uncharacterized protein n=1 Tax=Eretmocerus hayati TaxID=131215 RepID=A0ACC2NPX9_9HYME|nr:hypothetical protein QAD02_004401 [Eretmocerus hayati]
MIMKVLQVIHLTVWAHHPCGTNTLAFPRDIFGERDSYTFNECKTKLDLSWMGLTRVNRNFISGTCLENLSLKGNEIQDFEEGIFRNLTDLEYLDLSKNKLSPETLFSFGSAPSLKTLILDGNNKNRTHFTLNTKVFFPELTYLSLVGLNINSMVIDWSEYFPKIEKLDISGNKHMSMNEFFNNIPTTLRSLGMRAMGLTKLKIQNLKNVTSLDLDGNDFHSIKRSNCDEDSLCLENLDGLESLSLVYCDIELIEEHAFEHLTKLSYLDLRGNEIPRISSGTFGSSPSLSVLDISSNPLVNVSFISELKNLTTLRMNSMDSRAIESLFSLSSVPTKIQILSLSNNQISSIPPEFLDNLEDLREIDLRYNLISSLSPGSWQRNLKVLKLHHNKVSKIEDLHLSEAKSLELLNLRGNKLESIDSELRKALPGDLVLEL